MISPDDTVQMLWNRHLIDAGICYLCYYLIAITIFSEVCTFVRDSFLMTLSRGLFVVGCYFVVTSVDGASSRLFATAVLVLVTGISMVWTLYVIRAVQFGRQKTGKSIGQSLIDCHLPSMYKKMTGHKQLEHPKPKS